MSSPLRVENPLRDGDCTSSAGNLLTSYHLRKKGIPQAIRSHYEQDGSVAVRDDQVVRRRGAANVAVPRMNFYSTDFVNGCARRGHSQESFRP